MLGQMRSSICCLVSLCFRSTRFRRPTVANAIVCDSEVHKHSMTDVHIVDAKHLLECSLEYKLIDAILKVAHMFESIESDS